MRAAVFHGRRDIRIQRVPEPDCGRGDLLVEVHAAGICGTDAHEFATGPHMFPIHHRHPVSGHVGPMIPGHEVTGTVREIGSDVDGFELGDLIVSGAGISCGSCTQCVRGRTNLCVRYSSIGLQYNGGLAQFCAIPASTCLRVRPYGLSQDAAALAQPMSIAVHAMRRGRLSAGEQAVIIGAGGIGAFLTYAASSVAQQVAVADLNAERLRTAANLGAERTADLSDGVDLTDALREWGMQPAVVYEVSGTTAGLKTALSALGPGGRLVLVGLQSRPIEWDMLHLTLTEHEVIGTNSHVYAEDLPTALGLLASGQADWSGIAPVALCLDELVDNGIEPLVEGRSAQIKTLVDPWAPATRPTVMKVDS